MLSRDPDHGGGMPRSRPAQGSPRLISTLPALRPVHPVCYGAMRVGLAPAVHSYFRRLRTVRPGLLPAEGPVLRVVNHPSSLTDVLVLGVLARRRLRFVAHSGLFRFRLHGVFLAACHAAFEFGQVVVMFPEGMSRGERTVEDFRTGSARLALGYELGRRAGRARFALQRALAAGIEREHRLRPRRLERLAHRVERHRAELAALGLEGRRPDAEGDPGGPGAWARTVALGGLGALPALAACAALGWFAFRYFGWLGPAGRRLGATQGKSDRLRRVAAARRRRRCRLLARSRALARPGPSDRGRA